MITLVQVNEENSLHYRNENIGKFESVGGTATINIRPFFFMDLNLGLGLDFLTFGSQGSDTLVNLFVTLGIQLLISIGCVLLAAKRINPIHGSKK